MRSFLAKKLLLHPRTRLTARLDSEHESSRSRDSAGNRSAQLSPTARMRMPAPFVVSRDAATWCRLENRCPIMEEEVLR